jgi:tripeptidyl-peptidase-1
MMLYHLSVKFWTVLAVFAATARSSPAGVREGYVVKERHHVPRQWRRVSSAPAQHLIELSIGLKQSRFSELERHLYEGKP